MEILVNPLVLRSIVLIDIGEENLAN